MLRNGNTRDERRRRVLAEDRTAAGDSDVVPNPLRAIGAARSGKSSRPAETYTAAARREQQPRLSDFVPRRHWSFAGWVAGGLLMVAALLLTHDAWIHSIQSAAGDFNALDLRSNSSLAAWFGSATLMLSGLLSLYVYSVRRCRLDDYRARYRVWLWSGIVWTVMSIDMIVGVRHAVRAGMVAATGRTFAFDGDIWWLAPGGLIVAVLLIRLMFDARASRLAITSLILAALMWASATVLSLIEAPLSEHAITLLNAGLRLAGSWLLLVGTLANARYVILEANGELPLVEPKPKREKKVKGEKEIALAANQADSTGDASSAGKSAKVAKVDTAHAQPSRPAGQSSTGSATAPASIAAGQSTGAKLAGVAGVVGSLSNATAGKPLFSANLNGVNRNSVSGNDSTDDDEDSEDSDGGNHKLSRAERKKLRKQQRG